MLAWLPFIAKSYKKEKGSPAGEHKDVPQHICIIKTKENNTLCGPG